MRSLDISATKIHLFVDTDIKFQAKNQNSKKWPIFNFDGDIWKNNLAKMSTSSYQLPIYEIRLR